MTTDWKVKQEIYHRLYREHDDDLKNFDITISENVVEDAVQYFTSRDIGWVYPGKSYMVAICYARWLSKEFGGRPLEYLDDPELLYNNDMYFKHYSLDPHTYIRILDKIGGWDFNETSGLVPDVKKYFDEEFGITEWNMD
jgi:hypothetical protein